MNWFREHWKLHFILTFTGWTLVFILSPIVRGWLK